MGTGGASSYSYKKRHGLIGKSENIIATDNEFDEVAQRVDKFIDWVEKNNDSIDFSGLNSHTIYQQYLEYKGYGETTVLSDEEFLQYMVDNPDAKLLSRGMPDSNHMSGVDKLKQPMMSDRYYSGEGVFGDGLYFATDNNTVAPNYAITDRGGKGAIALAALKKNAKVINYSELRNFVFHNDKASSFIRDLNERIESSGLTMALNNVEGIMSVVAREMGYDAITKGHTVVLNRSAVVYHANVREFTNISSARAAISEYESAIMGARDGLSPDVYEEYRW